MKRRRFLTVLGSVLFCDALPSRRPDRVVHRLKPDGFYQRVPFEDLRRGDTFLLAEPDGTLATPGINVAASDAYRNPKGIWEVEIR